jgi:hypothetical protein
MGGCDEAADGLATMETALNVRTTPSRGDALLLFHCGIGAPCPERPSAVARLEQLLGAELAAMLLEALAGSQRLRGSSSP